MPQTTEKFETTRGAILGLMAFAMLIGLFIAGTNSAINLERWCNSQSGVALEVGTGSKCVAYRDGKIVDITDEYFDRDR